MAALAALSDCMNNIGFSPLHFGQRHPVGVSICPPAWRRSDKRAVSPLSRVTATTCLLHLSRHPQPPHHGGPGQNLLHFTMPDSPIFKKRQLPFKRTAPRCKPRPRWLRQGCPHRQTPSRQEDHSVLLEYREAAGRRAKGKGRLDLGGRWRWRTQRA